MKILLLDLSKGGEPISKTPGRYGGAGPTYYNLYQSNNAIFIAGNQNSFTETSSRFIFIDDIVDRILLGEKLETLNPEFCAFDLIIHSKSDFHVNTTVKQAVWCVGQGEIINSQTKRILLHSQNQVFFSDAACQVEYFTLGVHVPDFEKRPKEDFIFQCTNHYPQIQTELLACLCKKNGVRLVLAGPLQPPYRENVMRFVDNQTVHYVGELSESEKIKYLKNARFFAALYGYEPNEIPLSFKQALGYGCGIITTPFGAAKEIIKNGENGFLIATETDFLLAFKKGAQIDQYTCWKSVQRYNLESMSKSFDKAVNSFIID